jgi:hypothetical protein
MNIALIVHFQDVKRSALREQGKPFYSAGNVKKDITASWVDYSP